MGVKSLEISASGSGSALPEFSQCAKSAASGMRNVANQKDLEIWLDQQSADKIGVGAEQSSPRSEKARAWIKSVARGHMLRHGNVREAYPDELAAMMDGEPWVKAALDSGKKLSLLSFESSEEESLRSVLDWMLADDGPPLGSDWTRISWPQAEMGHDGWVRELARAAEKSMQGSQAFDGCMLLAPICDTKELAGWSWVEVQQKEALDREGALMKHCVGSYAKKVKEGSTSIYSLRDAEGKPHVTIEAQPGIDGVHEIVQIKGVANSMPKALHLMGLPALMAGLEERFDGKASISHARVFKGGLAGVGLAPGQLGKPGRIWRKEHPVDALAASRLARESAQGAHMDDLLPLAEFLKDMGYEKAVAEFLKEPRARLGWIKAQVDKEVDEVSLSLPDGVGRLDIEALRRGAMLRGLSSAARECQASLGRMSDSEFSSPERARIEPDELKRYSEGIDAADALISELAEKLADNKIKGAKVNEDSKLAGEFAANSPALGKLSQLFGQLRDHAVLELSSYLISRMARDFDMLCNNPGKRVEGVIPIVYMRLVQGRQETQEVGIATTWKKALSRPLSMHCDSSGVGAVIDGLSGVGKFSSYVEEKFGRQAQELDAAGCERPRGFSLRRPAEPAASAMAKDGMGNFAEKLGSWGAARGSSTKGQTVDQGASANPTP